MTFDFRKLAKGGIAAATVGAVALAGATPAAAQRHRDDDGISVGDVIAGAVIIGGIAAIANAASRDPDYYRGDRYYRDGRYYDDGYEYRRNAYRQRGNPRGAVERCVNAARSELSRYGFRYAQVTDIRDVRDTRYGWQVKGRVAVDDTRGYGRYDRYDRRGYRGTDNGTFTCLVERGRVRDVNFGGIRGLR